MSRNNQSTKSAVASRPDEIGVLHVRTVVGAGGGADKTTLKSGRYLKAAGYRAWAAYLRAPGDCGFEEIRKRAEAWSCPLIEIMDRGPFDLGIIIRLARICRQFDVRIWHAHEYKGNVIGLVLRLFFKLHLVSTVHGWVEFSPKLSLFYKLDRWALRRYDRVIAVSQDIFEGCLAAGVRPERLFLIQNAIELDAYRRRHPPAMAPGRTASAGGGLIRRVSPDRRVIGAVGRLSPEKGFDQLIDAFVNLCQRGFDLELWIAGEGPDRQALEKRAMECGFRERVFFLGFYPDVEHLFECFDVFCLPSLREGLPNVILEAMAMEVPIVATTVGGLTAALRNEEQALLVTPGSVSGLERGLSRLLESRDLSERLSCAARERVELEFDFRKRMDRVISLYNSLLNEVPARR